MGSSNFFSELKRRQIYRGGVMYVVAGWVIVQVATTVFPIFNIPDWAIRLVVVVIMLGFPLALVGLWMFESSGHRLASQAPGSPATDAPPVERRRRSDGDGEAIARLMETERAERSRANEELIAALDRLHAVQHAPHAEAPAQRIEAPVLEATRVAPDLPAQRPRQLRLGTVFTAVFVTVLAAWIVWVLIAPSLPVSQVGDAGKLTHQYVVPAYRQIEQFGAALLQPVLRKLGVHIAPDRAFTAIMLVIALLVLRNLYRSMVDARRRLRHR